MVLFPLPSLYPSEVPGLSTTQSRQGPVSAVSALYLKWRFVWKGVLMREFRCFWLDCRLTSGTSTSSSCQRLPHQGMRQSGQGFYPLMLDFTLGRYTFRTGDIYIGIYGKIQWYRAAAKWICLRLFTRARSLKKSLAAAAATSKSQDLDSNTGLGIAAAFVSLPTLPFQLYHLPFSPIPKTQTSWPKHGGRIQMLLPALRISELPLWQDSFLWDCLATTSQMMLSLLLHLPNSKWKLKKNSFWGDLLQ